MAVEDIVARLRSLQDDKLTPEKHLALVLEAANEIERLRVEVEYLRVAIRPGQLRFAITLVDFAGQVWHTNLPAENPDEARNIVQKRWPTMTIMSVKVQRDHERVTDIVMEV